jgi:hypothetical protein
MIEAAGVDDVAILRRVRQVRAHRAEAGLLRAQSAQRRATAALGKAEQAAADFAAARCTREAAMRRLLSSGPVPAQHLRQAAAQLAGFAAHAEGLRQRTVHAEARKTACDQATGMARSAHAAAARAASGVVLLQQRLDAAAASVAEQRLEADMDAAAARARPGMRARP